MKAMNQHQAVHLVESESAGDHATGAPSATVTIVEYGDFECPNCKQAAPALKLMLERFAGKVRLIYRHFPLEEVHPHALHAAEASESAGSQGQFWQMHDLLFAHQNQLKLPQLHGYAQSLELDMTRYTADIADHIHLQRIREHLRSGRESGVRATPTFFVNGMIQDVSFGLEPLERRIEAALRS